MNLDENLGPCITYTKEFYLYLMYSGAKQCEISLQLRLKQSRT